MLSKNKEDSLDSLLSNFSVIKIDWFMLDVNTVLWVLVFALIYVQVYVKWES